MARYQSGGYIRPYAQVRRGSGAELVGRPGTRDRLLGTRARLAPENHRAVVIVVLLMVVGSVARSARHQPYGGQVDSALTPTPGRQAIETPVGRRWRGRAWTARICGSAGHCWPIPPARGPPRRWPAAPPSSPCSARSSGTSPRRTGSIAPST